MAHLHICCTRVKLCQASRYIYRESKTVKLVHIGTCYARVKLCQTGQYIAHDILMWNFVMFVYIHICSRVKLCQAGLYIHTSNASVKCIKQAYIRGCYAKVKLYQAGSDWFCELTNHNILNGAQCTLAVEAVMWKVTCLWGLSWSLHT